MVVIRAITKSDWPAVWEILCPVFRAGQTYAYAPDISEDEAHRVWVTSPLATFVATGADGRIAGTYYLKPNQPGLGAHVCNCGYVVGAAARGQGVASAMCEHSQREAVRRGFRAMQYNLVVKSNETAIRLWKRHGFAVVGVLPEAFRQGEQGFVDAVVMYKKLV